MKDQSGQSMTEFLVVMPVMLLLILAAIQFVLIYQTKSTLNYATFEATRAGSLENASRKAVDYGFTRGFAPLFARFSTTRKEAGDDNYANLANKVVIARKLARKEVAEGHVTIELINPTSQMFQAFDNNTIPNDHLSFRLEENGINLQEANLLKLRITYCMKLIVPMVSSLITTVAGGNCDTTEHRFPIMSQAIIRMQSPAIQCKASPCFD
ncbi:MAG: pilus assembly protein [Woeseiaceae bacterium]